MKFRKCTQWKKVREPKTLQNYAVWGNAPPEIKGFENAIYLQDTTPLLNDWSAISTASGVYKKNEYLILKRLGKYELI